MKLRSLSSYIALCICSVLVPPPDCIFTEYTHFVKAQAGFSHERDKQLQREAKLGSIPTSQRPDAYLSCVDEVKIKEGVVYDKHSADIIGFRNIGEVSDQLLAIEQICLNATPHPQLTIHMLVFMVCGILSNLEFAYIQFPYNFISGEQLYSRVQGCVHHPEAAGFKFLATTCKGGSPNRKFIRLHGKVREFIHKTAVF